KITQLFSTALLKRSLRSSCQTHSKFSKKVIFIDHKTYSVIFFQK
ncbi:unnamed protein product, partial [Brassica rapa]